MASCPTCGDDFPSERSMKIHHKMSHGDSIAISDSTCLNCENKFTYYPSNKRGIYCESCVNDDSVTWSNGGLSGEDNPMFGIDPEDHPMWTGGYNINYIGIWNTVREKRLKLDDYTCQKCGDSMDELDQEPDVHHITPISEFENEKNAHTVENTVCLCRSCHGKVENMPIGEATERFK